MTTNVKTSKGPLLCGWCAGATVSPEPAAAHKKCWSPDAHPCACAQNKHRLNPALAERMASYCAASIELVYERHGRKRRVLSEDRKEQLREQLARAREAKDASLTQK